MKETAIHLSLLILAKDILSGALKYPDFFRDYILDQFEKHDEKDKNIHFVIDKNKIKSLFNKNYYNGLLDFNKIKNNFHVIILKNKNFKFNEQQCFCDGVINNINSRTNGGLLADGNGLFADLTKKNLDYILQHQLIHYVTYLFVRNVNKKSKELDIVNNKLVLPDHIEKQKKQKIIEDFKKYVEYLISKSEYEPFIRNVINAVKDKNGFIELSKQLPRYLKYDNIIYLSRDLKNNPYKQQIQFLYCLFKTDKNRYKKAINKIYVQLDNE